MNVCEKSNIVSVVSVMHRLLLAMLPATYLQRQHRTIHMTQHHNYTEHTPGPGIELGTQRSNNHSLHVAFYHLAISQMKADAIELPYTVDVGQGSSLSKKN